MTIEAIAGWLFILIAIAAWYQNIRLYRRRYNNQP